MPEATDLSAPGAALSPVATGETPLVGDTAPRKRQRSAPTLEDVARAAGVSRATVSRVVNGKRRVDPQIQDTVRKAIAATGYVPNLAARRLVTRSTGSVIVVVSGANEGTSAADPTDHAIDFSDPFFGRVVGGMLRALQPRGVDPTLMLVEAEPDRARVLSALNSGNADGVLLVTTHGDDPMPRMLADTDYPAVMFARPRTPMPLSFVDVAHRDGAALAADHLVARGCRNTAVIAGPEDVPAAVDRVSGFRDAMARHGQPFVPVAPGYFSIASGAEAMRRLLTEHPDLDGVFASNDLMALGAIQVLQAEGKRVPEDVAVIGFDDAPVCTQSTPTLTSVRQPFEDMAAEMARILAEQLTATQRHVTSVVFEPTLVVRESA